MDCPIFKQKLQINEIIASGTHTVNKTKTGARKPHIFTVYDITDITYYNTHNSQKLCYIFLTFKVDLAISICVENINNSLH